MFGVIVNSLAIAVGGVMGMLIGKGIPDKIKETVFTGLALCVMLIGISGAIKGQDTILIIMSIVIGAIIGEIIDIDLRLRKLGDNIQSKFEGKHGKFSEGFVVSTLLMCIGAMAIVGPLESGLTGNNSTLFAKSVIDGCSAIILSSTYGIGVVFTGVSVFIYQGLIALSASFIKGVLVESVITNITAVGSLLILGLGFNMLNLTKIKVANLLPAVLVPFVYQLILGWF